MACPEPGTMARRSQESDGEGSERISRARSILSLRCLQSFDKHVHKIIFQIPFVALYQMDPLQKKWKKLDIQGGLHLTERMLPATATADATTPCCGTLVLKSHEQPLPKQPYLRYNTDRDVEPQADIGTPLTNTVGEPPRGINGDANATSEGTERHGETDLTAGSREVSYRFFILNRCREEIFFQDITKHFEFEANDCHIFYKVWSPAKRRHEIYGLWIYEDKVRVELLLLLEQLVGRHESGGDDSRKTRELLPPCAPFLPGAAAAPNRAAASAAPEAPAAARSEAAAKHADLFASMWKPCGDASPFLPTHPVSKEHSNSHRKVPVFGGQDKNNTKKAILSLLTGASGGAATERTPAVSQGLPNGTGQGGAAFSLPSSAPTTGDGQGDAAESTELTEGGRGNTNPILSLLQQQNSRISAPAVEPVAPSISSNISNDPNYYSKASQSLLHMVRGATKDSCRDPSDSLAFEPRSDHTSPIVHPTFLRESGKGISGRDESAVAEHGRDDDILESNKMISITKGQLNRAILAAAASDAFAELVWKQLVLVQEQHESALKPEQPLDPQTPRRARHRRLRKMKQTVMNGV